MLLCLPLPGLQMSRRWMDRQAGAQYFILFFISLQSVPSDAGGGGGRLPAVIPARYIWLPSSAFMRACVRAGVGYVGCWEGC